MADIYTPTPTLYTQIHSHTFARIRHQFIFITKQNPSDETKEKHQHTFKWFRSPTNQFITPLNYDGWNVYAPVCVCICVHVLVVLWVQPRFFFFSIRQFRPNDNILLITSRLFRFFILSHTFWLDFFFNLIFFPGTFFWMKLVKIWVYKWFACGR